MDIGQLGISAALALAACGSAIGIGTAGMAAVGAWKKCFAKNKPAPFTLLAFVGAPLTQTIYGYILMNTLEQVAAETNPWLLLGVGVFGGLGMGFSAASQGKPAASGCDALVETGKGFGNYIMVLGIVETPALFVMVFLMGIV